MWLYLPDRADCKIIEEKAKIQSLIWFLSFFHLIFDPIFLSSYTSRLWWCLRDHRRCTAEHTRARSRSVALIAANNSRSCATISTTAACTRARGSSLRLVRNAASTSTIAVTWARIWRSIGIARSTAARNAARVSTNAWPTTCTCAFTRAWSRISVSNAAKRFRGRCCSSNIWGPIPANGRISARSARKRSPIAPTWPYTLGCTPVWSRTSATYARRPSPRSTISRRISITTLALSHTPAPTAVAGSRRVATWGLTSRSASSTTLSD